MTRLNLLQVIFTQSGLSSQLQWSKVNYTWIPIKKKKSKQKIIIAMTFFMSSLLSNMKKGHSDLENIKSGAHLLK